MALPKELSVFFRRRLHALGSKRHWKKRFNRGQPIGREIFENMPRNDARKLQTWALAHGGLYDVACDGIRMQRLFEKINPAISDGAKIPFRDEGRLRDRQRQNT
jgi:hypothetical protein